MADALKDLREAYEYDTNNWSAIRAEAKKDMRFVAGDPWDDVDKKARKDRPTVAPDELSQYRNAVINALMANPRGAKFAPTGNGANDKAAEFYAKKWREIEYRSQASQHYLNAADNALQRSYGFVRVHTDYKSPRDANQDLSIEGFPNPDMVLPDTDSLMLDGSDMKRCFVFKWVSHTDFKQRHGEKVKVANFRDFAQDFPSWVKGSKILEAEYWSIRTKPRQLVLIQLQPTVQPTRTVAPQPAGPGQFLQVFADELDEYRRRVAFDVVRELRPVDYPHVTMCLTNGLEILHEQDWPGKYIPIVSCYGKVLYTEGDAGMERKILSMTRFGREPWKAYCYACSQQLELLGRVPKASVLVVEGQLDGHVKDWEESHQTPKVFLQYKAITEETGGQVLPPPTVVPYSGAQELQALEVVKEGFRRSIQSAMGSNFLPTTAQRRNEKSGIALEKIEQMATQGTYHFVHAYNSLIRQCAVIGEDLMDKIHDYAGEVGVLAADMKAETIWINSPDKPDSISTKGDYLVTISTSPSSDSEREAAKEFTDSLVAQIERIAAIAGPKIAAGVLAKAIRMQNLGPLGDQLADMIEPPEFKTQNGEPPSLELIASKMQIQQLTELLQQAAQDKEARIVEQQGKFAIEKMKVDATSADKAADREVKLAVAAIQAKTDRTALMLEESQLVGVRIEGALQRLHDQLEAARGRRHEVTMGDRQHQQALEQGAVGHQQALEQADQAGVIAADAQVRDAALNPPVNGAGA